MTILLSSYRKLWRSLVKADFVFLLPKLMEMSGQSENVKQNRRQALGSGMTLSWIG